MKLSYGFIETQGYIAAIEAADAMVKAAKVELVRWRRVGGALVLIVVQGELSACQAAVDAGKAAAQRVGRLISAHVIPNPYDDTQTLVGKWLGGKGKAPPPEAPLAIDRQILRFLARAKNGADLQQLCAHFKIDKTQMRLYLKQMIDQQKIEKVQLRYFLLKGKKNK